MEHPLRIWLNANTPRLTRKAFAARIGVSDMTLARLIKGDPSTGRDVFDKIEEASQGELSATVLYEFHLQQRAAAREQELAAADERACA